MWLLTRGKAFPPHLSSAEWSAWSCSVVAHWRGVHVYFVPFEECLFVGGHPCLPPLEDVSQTHTWWWNWGPGEDCSTL